MVGKTIAHRLAREAKVLAALDGAGPERSLPEPELLARVYADTPTKLHAMALRSLRSLRAHLDKLAEEARVGQQGGHWQRLD